MEPFYADRSHFNRCYDVMCAYCSVWRVFRARGAKQAMSEAREDGWAIRGGYWACPDCVKKYDASTNRVGG